MNEISDNFYFSIKKSFANPFSTEFDQQQLEQVCDPSNSIIELSSLSDGERVLYNLVFNLSSLNIWFKVRLKSYLKSELALNDLISQVKTIESIYFPVNHQHGKFYHFNFWEIENLYLMEELLGCWISKKDGIKLNKDTYLKFLKNSKNIIFQEYAKTFLKSVVKFSHKPSKTPLENIDITIEDLESIKSNLGASLTLQIESLIDRLMEEELLHWFPGKEIRKALQISHHFDDSNFSHINTELSKKLQNVTQLFN